MTPVRDLIQRFGLHSEAERRFDAYLDLLTQDPTAPTTVTDPAAAVDQHLADALVALEVEDLHGARLIADLGSGAGVPGLPLAIALPDAHVTLVDSLERKGAFMRRAIEVTDTANADVVVARAEAWPEGVDRHDAVLVRAVATLNVLLEYAAPLLREGGVLVAWKAQLQQDEATDAATAADVLGLALEPRRPVQPFAAAEHRALYVARKIAPTPAGYPRREGMARKRPIRAAPQRH